MPIIVPIEDNKVGLATATDAKFHAPDTSGSGLDALGAGLVQLGGGLEERRRRAAEAIAAAMLDDRHHGNIDDAAVKKAYVDYSDPTHDALHGKGGLFNQQGADAHAAFPALVEKLVYNHDKSLSKLDDVQRAAIAPVMGERLRSDVSRAADFVRQQGMAEQKRQSEQLQKAAARDAVNHADDSDLFDHHLATGEKAIRQQAKIDNVGDKLLDKQIADYKSGIYADTIDVLNQRDPVHAADWYARNADSLNRSDKQRAEAALARAPTVADSPAEAPTALAASAGDAPVDDRAIQLVDDDATASGTGPLQSLGDSQTDADADGSDSDPYADLRSSMSRFPGGGNLENANFVTGGNSPGPQRVSLAQRWMKLNQQQRLADPELALPAKMLEAMRAPLLSLDPRFRSKIGLAAAPAGKYVADQIVWMLEHKVLPRRIASSHFPTANEVRLAERGAWSSDALAALHEAADRALNVRQRMAWHYFTDDKFLTPAQAAGLIAALTMENNLDPEKWQGFRKNAPGFGIAQWNVHRREMFETFAKRPLQGSSFQQQLEFVRYELEHGEYRHIGDLLRAQDDAYQSGYLMTKFYEIPDHDTREQKSADRGRYARDVLQELTSH